MSTETPRNVRYEDSAEVRTLTGWCCTHCNRFYGNDEHMARYCCATSLPCECGGRRIPSYYTRCAACRKKDEDAKWAAIEKVEWDGETPVCQWDGDRYFFGEDVIHHVNDHVAVGGKVEDLRLVLCTPSPRPSFEMAEFLHDYLGPDGDAPPCRAIDKVVDDWIAENVVQMWEPDGVGISVESLRSMIYPGD